MDAAVETWVRIEENKMKMLNVSTNIGYWLVSETNRSWNDEGLISKESLVSSLVLIKYNIENKNSHYCYLVVSDLSGKKIYCFNSVEK